MGACRACVALDTLGSGRACGAGQAVGARSPLVALRACGAGGTSGALGAGGTNGTHGTDGTLKAGDPGYALGSGRAGGTGQDQYYRSMQEQFSSWRFLELLQEAAAPSNLGKIYMVCFDAVYPADLEYYFDMLQVAPDGTKWLKLPGFPPECQPVIPPNVYITAVLDADDAGTTLGRNVLRHAGLIEFRLPPEDYRPVLRLLAEPGVPPTGYQRLWQRSALHSLATARARLVDVLGYERMARLHYSADLALLFWRSGQALMKETLDELTIFVANSFDHDGRGLFDPDNPQRNAEIAYDAQVIQRTLWRLNTLGDDELRHDLLEYLDRLARDDAPREQGTRREAVHTAGTQAPIMRPITQQAVA